MDLSEVIIDSSLSYKKRMKIPKMLRSSENSKNVSLTVKGLVLMAVIAVLNYYGITVDQGQVVDVINQTVALIAGLITLIGAIRKVKNA